MKVNVIVVYFAVLLISSILGRVVENIYILRIGQIMGLGGLFVSYKYSSYELKLISVTLGFLFLFILKIYLYEEAYLRGFFAASIVGAGLIYFKALERNPKVFTQFLVTISWISSIYVFANLFFLGVDSNEIIRGSRNYITTLFLALSSGTLIGLREGVSGKLLKVSAYAAIMTMSIITFVYTGRTGIVVSLGLIILASLQILSPSIRIGSLLISVGIVSALLGIGFLLGLHEMSSGWERTQEKEIEGVRMLIWSIAVGYMLDPTYFMGVPEGFWEQLTGYSSHNSYIDIYSHFSWIGLAITLISIIYYMGISIKVDKVIAGILFLIVSRSFFDLTLLSTDLGPFFILCIILANEKS